MIRQDMDNNKASNTPEVRTPQWNLLDISLVSAAIIVFFIGAALGTQIFFSVDEAAEITILTSVLLALLEAVVLIFSVYFFGVRRRGYDLKNLGLIVPNSYWMIVGTIIGLMAIPLSALVTITIQISLGKPIENPQLPFLAPEGFSLFGGLMMFVLAGLVVPFAEEIYFRGMLYPWMRDRWGVWPGILLSSLIFGAVHGEFSIAGSAFILGALMAWTFEKSGSLWIAIMIHAINNGVKILMLYIFLGLGLTI